MSRRSPVLVIIAAFVIAACGGDDDAGPTGPDPDAVTVVAGEPFPDARCEANRAAGTITFLTGFDFAAAASIIEVITAEAQGFYEALCLDVELLSSFSTANYPLVAGGQGQFASGGSFSEVVNFATTSETDLVAVTVAGRSPIDTLMVKPAFVSADDPELTDLAGTTVGVKGKLPASIEVMMLEAGLTNGIDFDVVLLEGFDPVAHFAIDAISAVPGWKSNEPGRLEREGVEFIAFAPSDAGVPGSFGAIFTTRSFIEQHPTAAEDFVRATLRGLAAAIEDPAGAAAAAVALIEEGGNPNFLSLEGEIFRWEVEAALIAGSVPANTAAGTPDLAGLTTEVTTYLEIGFFEGTPDPADHVDDSFARTVTAPDGTVIWPG